MLPEHYDEVKELIEEIADSYGEPDEDQVAEMNRLTGRDWDAESLQMICCEYWSHNSLDETAYHMLHGDLPSMEEVEMAFWRYKPGVSGLDPAAVYNKYCFGRCKTMKALEQMPFEDIVQKLKAQLSQWELKQNESSVSFERKDPERPWHTEEISLRNYYDQMIKVEFTNISDHDQQIVMLVMEELACLCYQPE